MFSGADAARSNPRRFRRRFIGNGFRKRHDLPDLKPLIEKLRNGIDLNSGDIDLALAQLLSDKVDDESKAEFLTVLHKKGETAEEIVAFVKQLMKRAVDPMIDPAQMPGPMIDI